MGFLKLFSGSASSSLAKLPSGSFTVDSTGRVITSTLPQSFPPDQVREIAHTVLSTFKSAQEARLPLTEISINYSSLKLIAKELRGGAIIFLTPRALAQK